MKYTEKHFAVLFLHTEGWTVSCVVKSKAGAEQELLQQQKMLPNFLYRIVPCTVLFDTTLPSKQMKLKAEQLLG